MPVSGRISSLCLWCRLLEVVYSWWLPWLMCTAVSRCRWIRYDSWLGVDCWLDSYMKTVGVHHFCTFSIRNLHSDWWFHPPYCPVPLPSWVQLACCGYRQHTRSPGLNGRSAECLSSSTFCLCADSTMWASTRSCSSAIFACSTAW